MPSFIAEVVDEVSWRVEARVARTPSLETKVVDLTRVKVLAWRARITELAAFGFRFAVGAALLRFGAIEALALGVAVLAGIALLWRIRYELLRRGRRGWAAVPAGLAVASTGGVALIALLLHRPGAGAFFVAAEVCAGISRHDRAEVRAASARSGVVVAA